MPNTIVHAAIKRVLIYTIVMAMLITIATYFTESRVAFMVTMGVGFAIGALAELTFWIHVIGLPWRRRGRQ